MFELLDNNLVGIVVTDSAGRAVYANAKSKQILNLRMAGNADFPFESLVGDEFKLITSEPSLIKLKNGNEVLMERKSIQKDGQSFEVYFLSDLFDFRANDRLPSSIEGDDDVENLKIDVVLKDIQIDRKEYELQSMKALIYLLSGLQDIQMIANKFVDFCFQHFLFSKGLFFQRLHDEVADGFSVVVNLPMNKVFDADDERQWAAEFLKNHSSKLNSIHGIVPEIDDTFRESLNKLGIPQVNEVLCYPLVINERNIGFFLFVTEEGHFGVESEDLLLLEDLIQLTLPIFNNAFLMEDSLTDELTKLKNRRMFDLSLNREIALAEDLGKEFSLIALDIDRFKLVNDRYGHAVGDMVIRALGAQLRQQIRHHDAAFRFGGEEFMVLVTGNVDIAKIIAGRIQEAIRNLKVPLDDGTDLQFTVSLGIAQYHDGLGALEFFELADKALYQSKNDGRDRMTVASFNLPKSA